MKAAIFSLTMLIFSIGHTKSSHLIKSILQIREMKQFLDAFKQNGTHEKALKGLEGVDRLMGYLTHLMPTDGRVRKVS